MRLASAGCSPVDAGGGSELPVHAAANTARCASAIAGEHGAMFIGSTLDSNCLFFARIARPRYGRRMVELSAVEKRVRRAGDKALLRGVNLSLRAGEVLLIAGASGSGKTTLLDLVIGKATADAGTVKVFDRDVARLRASSIARLRRRIGMVPQEILLLEDETALANVALPLEILALPRNQIRARAVEALATVGLGHVAEEPVARLSSSQRRMVAFARAIVAEPAILLADEPMNDLDSIRKDELCSLIDELRGKNTACIVTTNDTQALGAAALCGWRHCELRGGTLHALDLGFDRTRDEDDEDPGRVPNVVPFPLAAGGGE